MDRRPQPIKLVNGQMKRQELWGKCNRVELTEVEESKIVQSKRQTKYLQNRLNIKHPPAHPHQGHFVYAYKALVDRWMWSFLVNSHVNWPTWNIFYLSLLSTTINTWLIGRCEVADSRHPGGKAASIWNGQQPNNISRIMCACSLKI